MNFDQLGPSWRTKNEATVEQTPADEKRLEQHVATTRATERFWAKILRRDLIETLACVFVIYSFGSSLWDLAKTAERFALPQVAAAGMAINIVAAVYVMWRLYRTRTSTPMSRLDVSMREYCDSEIERVEKQIAILRSVHIWYLMPFYVGVTLIFFAIDGPCTEFVGITFIVTVMYVFLFALNRFTASTSVADVRNELVALRDSLSSESAPIGPPATPPNHMRATWRFVIPWFLILLGSGTGVALFGLFVDVEYPKRSPFDAVRWLDEAPEVRLEEDWYRLRSIEGIETEEIVAYCQRNYFAKWRKRFEEDLVEVLTCMGHPPGETVRLVVSPLDADERLQLDRVRMSEDKRWAIRRAAAIKGRVVLPAEQPPQGSRLRPERPRSDSSPNPRDAKMRNKSKLLAGLLSTGAAMNAVALTPAEIDRLAKPYIDSKTVVGMTVGVLQDGETVVRGYGRMSSDDSRTPDGSTIYEIGSVSKVFTGLLLADAVVNRRVSLVTPAEDLLPKGVTMNRRHESLPIRLWHLSTHTSGLPRLPDNLNPADPNNPYADYDGKRLAEFLRDYQPRKRPGEQMKYSNLGVGLLGNLIARERKLSYEALLAERIAAPLKLTDTGTELDATQRERLAPPHQEGGAPGFAWDIETLAGAGAIRSSAADLLKFAQACLDPPEDKLGQAIDLAWMVHQKPIEANDFAMGLGWHVAKDGSTRWHNGETGGYHAAIFVSRPLKTAVVVLTNTATGEVDTLAQQIVQVLAGAPAKPREFDEAVSVAPEVMQRYIGKYQLAPTFVFTVTVKDGQMSVGITNQATQPVFPESDTVFRYKSVDAALRFEVGRSGKCNAVTLLQNGVEQTAKRIE